MADIGDYALRFAFAVAILGIGAGIYAGAAKRPDWTRVAERCVQIVFVFTTIAMGSLFVAFGTGDFSLAYVAQHSALTMPTGYRLAALWGGQAGSLLLWAWMVSAFGCAATWFNRDQNRGLMPWVCASILGNLLFFLVLTNFLTNPFDRLLPSQVMSDGQGLNPLLQHPVMLIHPLLLYTGFTGFVVPYSFALAALISGELGTTWFRTTRRWTLFAWSVLGVGFWLGGRWAYEVLGWGGYWAWDPVENASFMPWLVATAYVHSVMIQEKRGMLKIWNLALIGLTYSFCLFGTFLTRSGIVQSVHAFTNADWFGKVFAAYVVVTVVMFFGLLFYRRGELRSTTKLESVVSREAGFLLNNWVFLALLGVVLWGTMFPVITESVLGDRKTLLAPYFNLFAGPLALILLFLTGVGPLIAWRRASVSNLRNQFTWPCASALVVGSILTVALWGEVGFFSLGCWTLSAFVVGTITQEYARAMGARMRNQGESAVRAFATLIQKNQRRYGGYIVHLGVVLILVGIAGSGLNEEKLVTMSPGDSAHIQNYRLEYLTARAIPAQHYGGARARIALYRNDEPLAVMAPEKRMYWLEEQPSSIPAIYSSLREDVYVILTAVESDGSATIKIYRNPLVNWIWIGGVVFILGSLVVMWPTPERREPAKA